MKNLKNFDLEDFRQENLHWITHFQLYNKYLMKELGLCCYPHKGCNKIPAHRYCERSWKSYRKTQYKN